MTDSGEKDEKVLAVPSDDPRFAEIKDLADVNKHTLKEISHFFLTYKQIQKKEVSVEEWQGKEAAEAAFDRAVALYKEKK
jgi:inorganic pyrophosphatase